MPKTMYIQGHKLIAALMEWVPAVLNTTVGTVSNIAYKMKNNTLDSPKKTRLHTKWMTNLDIGSIRDQIDEMYKTIKKIVSLESIHKKIGTCSFLTLSLSYTPTEYRV
ncbi:uncharacterized protein LOC143190934 [Rhynchophorus ferrugineus]|uniref:uncharacterized protein LOC143190934 n=1 Tax=Rhynchophorus ferrugineus TaxID=354439 RepID=UPI003FCE5B20